MMRTRQLGRKYQGGGYRYHIFDQIWSSLWDKSYLGLSEDQIFPRLSVNSRPPRMPVLLACDLFQTVTKPNMEVVDLISKWWESIRITGRKKDEKACRCSLVVRLWRCSCHYSCVYQTTESVELMYVDFLVRQDWFWSSCCPQSSHVCFLSLFFFFFR